MNYIVFDCETANTLDDPIMYDCGWSVVNAETGITLLERSFVVYEVFCGMKDLMKCAYFADKIPQYLKDIADGKRDLRRLYTIRRTLKEDADFFGVTDFYAHNAHFDYTASLATMRYTTSSFCRYFFPYGAVIKDSLKMSREIFGKNEDYVAFCRENGFVRANGKTPRFTAEVLFKYLSKNLDFEESHTGLEDTQIERVIVQACLMADPTVEARLFA